MSASTGCPADVSVSADLPKGHLVSKDSTGIEFKKAEGRRRRKKNKPATTHTTGTTKQTLFSSIALGTNYFHHE